MNLEKEIEKYYYDNFAFISSVHIPTLDILTAIAKHFVEWQKQQDQQTIELAEDHAMLAGMMKEREQMMKEAVDAYIADSFCPASDIGTHLHGFTCTYEEKNTTPYVIAGKRFKLIILKNDESK